MKFLTEDSATYFASKSIKYPGVVGSGRNGGPMTWPKSNVPFWSFNDVFAIQTKMESKQVSRDLSFQG